jgi:hypothetical protein
MSGEDASGSDVIQSCSAYWVATSVNFPGTSDAQ